MEASMKGLNWKNDPTVAWAMVAQASRGVGGKYRITPREDSDGVWFEVEHLVHNGCRSFRHADWERTPVQHQPVPRTYREAMLAAEADNDQRRAIKDRNAA
jgi:hypothetical protein